MNLKNKRNPTFNSIQVMELLEDAVNSKITIKNYIINL